VIFPLFPEFFLPWTHPPQGKVRTERETAKKKRSILLKWKKSNEEENW